MASDTGKVKIGMTLTVTLSLAIVLLAPSSVMPATINLIGNGEIPLTVQDFSAVPQSMIAEANDLAGQIFGNHPEKCDKFVNQLLATYLAAKDKDFIIIFNAGGWGWTTLEDSSGWQSILYGIKAELDSLGYSSLLLNYQRAAYGIQGYLCEILAALSFYPSKPEELALRVDFLTRHLPDIKVILTGESNGTIICDKVMRLLKDNGQVYSIIAGPPFWNSATSSGRLLVLRSNGVVPDSFSQGDFFAIIRANLEALFGLSPGYPGRILLHLEAPGHDYSWQYHGVNSRIIEFLDSHFGLEQ